MKITAKMIKETHDHMWQDFGIKLTDAQAREIVAGLQGSSVVWTSEKYATTRTNDDIQRVDASGVTYSAYRTRYSIDEWNKAVRNGKV